MHIYLKYDLDLIPLQQIPHVSIYLRKKVAISGKRDNCIVDHQPEIELVVRFW